MPSSIILFLLSMLRLLKIEDMSSKAGGRLLPPQHLVRQADECHGATEVRSKVSFDEARVTGMPPGIIQGGCCGFTACPIVGLYLYSYPFKSEAGEFPKRIIVR